MTAIFKVPTRLQTAILANSHAQRMADDTLHALRNAGIIARVEVVLKDTGAGVIANIEVNVNSGVKKSDIEKVINIMYGD